MTPEIQYYAIIAIEPGQARMPSGLARRIYEPEGPVDQTLCRDLSWMADSAIVEWEYGDLGAELIKISEDEAARLRDAFRTRWGRPA
jgi:hypothetical protein